MNSSWLNLEYLNKIRIALVISGFDGIKYIIFYIMIKFLKTLWILFKIDANKKKINVFTFMLHNILNLH